MMGGEKGQYEKHTIVSRRKRKNTYSPLRFQNLLEEKALVASMVVLSDPAAGLVCHQGIQEEDHINNLETPCGCSGSLKFAHRECVQRWCNEKGDITCEICHQQYKPGYTAPPSRAHSDDTTIDISGAWTISGTPLNLHDPRLLVMAAAERHLLEAEYEDYAATNASGAAFCRSAALILMALLLLRHALIITNTDGDDDASTAFSLFLLRVAGFLLTCYIMAWAINVLQRRRQRQEAAALAATEVAFVLQSGQRRGLQFTIAPGPGVITAHQRESLQ
ncbi:hypothetical protein MRB53_000030 [Persea americana]|uniref:Uncharacterized protein n=1 Tax=Persea americana TaxID=3435 RepID=A0ACC2MMM2_PERAE|nr:hypothetical protein MRB53_000030 [Persea americana]